MSSFSSPLEKHNHCLKNILSYFREYDDFMESVSRVLDIGCDVEAETMTWWADATTKDSAQIPLNIQCVGLNTFEKLNKRHNSIAYQNHDIETFNSVSKPFDVLLCYDQLQYLLNPYAALSNWWHVANKDAMLIIAVPQTTNTEYNVLEYNVKLEQKYHYTMPQLIYMLAVSGWDCRSGFFKKNIGDPWLYAVVYRSDIEPMDPRTTNLYKLVEHTDLLPITAVNSISKYGMLRQRDLILPWLDKNNMWMEQE